MNKANPVGSTNLNSFQNRWYDPGKNVLIRLLWYVINSLFLNSFIPLSSLKVFWLRVFGAKIGSGVVIKPFVSVKYPWKLKVGNNCWLGEQVWIDNLGEVTLGNNVCISQGALIITGNHNYKSPTFDLMVGEIFLEDGVWICAKAIVGPGSILRSHSILGLGSVYSGEMEAYYIYTGVPAIKSKKREIG